MRGPGPHRSDGNVARCHDETARSYPDRLALKTERGTYTHAELRDRSARFAGGLRELGLGPGDRVGLYARNHPEFVVAALGALKAGTPFTPLNPQYRPREVTFQLTDADVAAVVASGDCLDRLADAVDAMPRDPTVITVAADADDVGSAAFDSVVEFEAVDGPPTVVDRDDDDVAMQPYTSGTTGRAKGVRYTHRNLRAQTRIAAERTNLDPEDERFLSVLPLSHIAGFVNRTWQPLVRGATVYLRDPESWSPDTAMSLIEEHEITKFGAVTAMYVDMVNHDSFGDHDLSSLHEAMQGGTKLPTAVQRRFEEVTGVELFEAYGLTETGGGTHVGLNSTFGSKRGTIGQPLRATDCKVVDDDGEEVPTGEAGELLVRGPHVMAGYHDRPDADDAAFTDDGYLRTGDVARRDEDNYYEIIDRKSDVIVTAGYNVYPAEVEGVLYEHPGVSDAAVVGVPDERRNATVKAYVVPTPSDRPTARELREYVLGELAAYKHPRAIEFVESLPRTASGKVQKFKLRA